MKYSKYKPINKLHYLLNYYIKKYYYCKIINYYKTKLS